MIILFTDFGASDIYVGQVHAVLIEKAPGVPVVDLLHSAHDFDVCAGAHLLYAFKDRFPAGSVYMTVIDPGVGSERAPLMVKADERWFVAPDNGLLSGVILNASTLSVNKVLWPEAELSESFHGRDLFAPVAAMLASGATPKHESIDPVLIDWQQNLDQVIYIDHYGNAITGRSGDSIGKHETIRIHGREIRYARVFNENPSGGLFWYVNSIGLVEIAANRARADTLLGLHVGDIFSVNSA